jgi:hypothetical protein
MHYFKSNSNFGSYDLANNVNWESVNVIYDQKNPSTATITVNPDDCDKNKFNESFFIYVKNPR